MDEEEAPEPIPEAVYKWTIRALYLVAFAANFYMLWDAYKDTVEVKLLTAKAKAQWRRLTRRVHASEEFRKAANRLHWEAITIVEDAAHGDTEASSG